jgi:dihydrodipicolinate synthase/N-acetylneuraminate lyase
MNDFNVHVALATPYTEGGELDKAALPAHIELLIDDGVDGLLVAGTTGEGPLLEEPEVEAVIAAAVRAVDGRIEVIGQVGRASTAATLRTAAAATGVGADALMAVLPWYYGLGDEPLLRHYEALLGAGDGLPVMAYTFPDRTGNELSAELLDRLAGEGLAGLKDSTMSPERQREYLEVAGRHDGFRLFSGSERLLLPALEGPGAGAISALANARPDVLLAVREQRTTEAQEAVNAARDELPEIPDIKRAVSERMAERGVEYRPDARAPLGYAASSRLRAGPG